MHKLTPDRMKWGLYALLTGLALAETALSLPHPRLRVWDHPVTRSRFDRPMWVLQPKRQFRENAIALSPDGATLATGGWEGANYSICLWDVATRRLRRTLAGHRDYVSSVAFSPRGDLLVSGSYDKTLKLWDASTGRLMWTSGGHCGYVLSVAFSPDGRTVASAEITAVNVWDVQAGKLKRQMKSKQNEQLLSAAYSPHGRLLAIGRHFGFVGGAGDAILWNVQTGRPVRRLIGCSSAVCALVFSPDGSILVSNGAGETAFDDQAGVSFWDVSTGKLRATAPAYPSWRDARPFAFDGKVLMTRGDTIQMRDSSSGAILRTIEGGRYGFTAAALSADGRILAGARDDDSTVKLWRLR